MRDVFQTSEICARGEHREGVLPEKYGPYGPYMNFLPENITRTVHI